jgi:hypothetical protein
MRIYFDQEPAMRHLTRTLVAASAASVLSVAVLADTPPAASSTPDPGALSSSLGLYVFPAKNQTAQTQSNDEAACFGWAKTRSGIDPMAIKPRAAATTQQAGTSPSDAGKGAVAGGAVKGALLGTAVGAIAGDTGKGAAIGATTGAFAGAGAKRQAKSQAAATQQQQQAAAEQAAAASVAQQKADYNKAFSACMEGKGYTVK